MAPDVQSLCRTCRMRTPKSRSLESLPKKRSSLLPSSPNTLASMISPHSTRGRYAFLNAGLSALGDRLVNDRIIEIIRASSLGVFAPQLELPLGGPLSALEIKERNVQAIRGCALVVSVLDKPGLGVAYEIGVADTLSKPVIAFRTEFQPYVGKILEGVWESLPQNRRATSFDELQTAVISFAMTK